MELLTATESMAALAQTTRLEAFRLLVRHEPSGLPAGDIALRLDVPANTMSSHLAILSRAGLVTSQRRSRSIVYRANIEALRALMLFLAKDCCGGRDDLCAPLIQDLSSC